jgi:hypothetical protein
MLDLMVYQSREFVGLSLKKNSSVFQIGIDPTPGFARNVVNKYFTVMTILHYSTAIVDRYVFDYMARYISDRNISHWQSKQRMLSVQVVAVIVMFG